MSEDVLKFKGVLLEAGVSNRSGRIYSEECLVEMEKQINEKIKTGTAFIAGIPPGGVVQVDTIYGQLDHPYIEEEDGRKKLKVEGRFLGTPMTTSLISDLEKFRKEGETVEQAFNRLFVVRPAGVGSFNQRNEVDPETYRFLCANIFPKEEE